jgi:putative transposase
MMQTVTELGPRLGIAPTCGALGLSRATYYRCQRPKSESRPRTSPRSLSIEERQAVLDILHEPRFVDRAPAEVHATLLDEDRYLCSVRTMHRILAANQEVRERRNQRRHPRYPVPELVATGPNTVWSWDITKLRGPVKWTHYYLYVILDIFSRYVTGWMVADREWGVLAKRLIVESCRRQHITSQQLTVHADRGGPMRSKSLALLLADLGIQQSHSRPRVSNDNPYSESQFKTLKYQPEFPRRFGSLEDARAHCADFFTWYNTEHHHSALGFLTPADVHYALSGKRIAGRAAVLKKAYAAHPERFPHGVPLPPEPPKEVWINKPRISLTQPAAPESEAEGRLRAERTVAESSSPQSARPTAKEVTLNPTPSQEAEEALL